MILLTKTMLQNSFIILICTFLLSCSLLDSGNIAPGYKAAYDGMRSYFFPKENEKITSQTIKNIPYASALIRIGKSSQSLIILESIDDDVFNYVSSDSIFLSFKQGRIVLSSGLSNNLVKFVDPFSLRDISLLTQEELSYLNLYSYDYPELIELRVNARIEFIGLEEVDLFTTKKTLKRYEETISNSYLGWKEKNIFWIDEEGYVWKSIQHISPKLPAFEIIITKKPA